MPSKTQTKRLPCFLFYFTFRFHNQDIKWGHSISSQAQWEIYCCFFFFPLMLHPGVRWTRVLFCSIRRSSGGIKVYIICGWFQSILRCVVWRSRKVNSIVKVWVFIAVWGLQVQPVRVAVFSVGVFLTVVQLLMLLTMGKKNKLLKCN